jgi:hypothetical protein
LAENNLKNTIMKKDSVRLKEAAKKVESMFVEYTTAYHADKSNEYNYHHALALEKVLKKGFFYTDGQISELSESMQKAAKQVFEANALFRVGNSVSFDNGSAGTMSGTITEIFEDETAFVETDKGIYDVPFSDMWHTGD